MMQTKNQNIYFKSLLILVLLLEIGLVQAGDSVKQSQTFSKQILNSVGSFPLHSYQINAKNNTLLIGKFGCLEGKSSFFLIIYDSTKKVYKEITSNQDCQASFQFFLVNKFSSDLQSYTIVVVADHPNTSNFITYKLTIDLITYKKQLRNQQTKQFSQSLTKLQPKLKVYRLQNMPNHACSYFYKITYIPPLDIKTFVQIQSGSGAYGISESDGSGKQIVLNLTLTKKQDWFIYLQYPNNLDYNIQYKYLIKVDKIIQNNTQCVASCSEKGLVWSLEDMQCIIQEKQKQGTFAKLFLILFASNLWIFVLIVLYRRFRNKNKPKIIELNEQNKVRKESQINMSVQNQIKNQKISFEIMNDYSLCSICLQAKSDSKLPCSHIFHQQCILEWLKKQQKCPYCRKVSQVYDIEKIK